MGGLFGSKREAQKVTPPARMPDDEDPAVQEARRRAAGAAQARSGRTSTVLTNRAQRSAGQAGQAGATPYKNSFLGQAG